MEINDLKVSKSEEHSTRSRAWEADRNFRGGLTKDPVELGVIRDVGDAHRKKK
jgi:hypothetical protein